MTNLIKHCFVIAVIFTTISCRQKQKTHKNTGDETRTEKPLAYAKEFKIEKGTQSTHLSIFRKGEDNVSDAFTLVKNEADLKNYTNAIKVPCKKIVCLSSTQLAYFFTLDDIDDIVAINSSRYLRHEGMKAKIKSGAVKRIGKEGNFNIEMVAALNPDVIFVSPFKAGGFDALRSLGIPLVPMAAYNEQTPLGRAEWIKMIALFLGQEDKADSLFNGIQRRYTHLKDLAKNAKQRPTVLSGKMRSGNWYVPGGNSFYAHYFRDAGAEYIIKDDKQGAYPVDFETIYQKASQCDYWRIVHPEKSGISLCDLAQQDPRYADFKAFQTQNVILCNIREKPYYEQVSMKPDVLLSDYIHYFHPELLPDYKPVFYERLK